jgi:type IV secretion system protein VirD4
MWSVVALFSPLLALLVVYPVGVIITVGVSETSVKGAFGAWTFERELLVFHDLTAVKYGVLMHWHCWIGDNPLVGAAGRSIAVAWAVLSASGPGTLMFRLFVSWAAIDPGAPRIRRAAPATAIHGEARWLTSAELSSMSTGLLLGRDQRGSEVRVEAESNLLSEAPPRSGKGAGLIIPNLLAVGDNAWRGPAVVVDPKAESVFVTGRRRAELGRRVLVIDPYLVVARLPVGVERVRWNPLLEVAKGDLSAIQAIAGALVRTSGDAKSAYFERAARSLLVGTIDLLVTLPEFQAHRNLSTILRWLTGSDADLVQLAEQLRDRGTPAALAAAGVLGRGPDERGSHLGSATSELGWLLDDRMAAGTAESDFSLSELATGGVDLFIVMPGHAVDVVAPWVRLVIGLLLRAAQVTRFQERVIVYLDEMPLIGRLDELVRAFATLPGLNLSIWGFYQSMNQLISAYGGVDARTLSSSAEFRTASDLSESESLRAWSDALGIWTADVESRGESTSSSAMPWVLLGRDQHGRSRSRAPQPVALMSPTALSTMPRDQMVVKVNSKKYPPYPAKLKKALYFRDPRYAPHADPNPYVSRAGE